MADRREIELEFTDAADMIEENTAALFITNRGFLTGTGGVQWCTREYVATLRAAGFALQLVEYGPDRSRRARLLRRLRPHPFCGVLPEELTQRSVLEARSHSCRYIFLNNTEALPMASMLRSRLPDVRFIFLSHGAEITDVVNNLRFASDLMPRAQRSARWLGELVKQELRLRTLIDGTVCISGTDLQIEQLLGSSRTVFLPRQVRRAPIDLAPIAGRVGCVATLNHGPNLHGLELFLQALDNVSVSVRLVGGPKEIGERVGRMNACVKYLGPLDDVALLEEAKTWTSFVNPIFCEARGASTKVATALGWGLPVLTTPQGARGYVWDEKALPLAKKPSELAANVTILANGSQLDMWQARAEEVVARAPALEASAGHLEGFLAALEPNLHRAC